MCVGAKLWDAVQEFEKFLLVWLRCTALVISLDRFSIHADERRAGAATQRAANGVDVEAAAGRGGLPCVSRSPSSSVVRAQLMSRIRHDRSLAALLDEMQVRSTAIVARSLVRYCCTGAARQQSDHCARCCHGRDRSVPAQRREEGMKGESQPATTDCAEFCELRHKALQNAPSCNA